MKVRCTYCKEQFDVEQEFAHGAEKVCETCMSNLEKKLKEVRDKQKSQFKFHDEVTKDTWFRKPAAKPKT